MRQDPARDPGAAQAVAGEAEAVDQAAAQRPAEERRKPGGGADRPAPGVGKLQPLERRKMPLPAGTERLVVARRMVAGGIDPVTGVVGRLAGAPQDPPVRSRPVVVEEGA